MRSPVILGAIAAVLLVAGCGVWWLMKDRPSTNTSTTTGVPTPKEAGAQLLLRTSDGQVVSVPDFTYGHPSLEIEDLGRTYVYVTQNDDTTEQDSAYGIVYGGDGTLVIGLFEQPFSESRLKAERKLRELVPVPDAILCALPVTVGVPDTIESRYQGQDLGLSFCPGATTLN